MALYAIGDVQGCLHCLKRLLEHIGYDPAIDELWFVGDLVNRGPDSLGTLRFIRESGAKTVLGNHDLHLLAVAAGARPLKARDTFGDILTAPDHEELLRWLAGKPLVVRDDQAGWVMVHAGFVPAWDVDTATALAREVEAALIANYRNRDFLAGMYGDTPARWEGDLTGMARIRFVINAMTRLRFCDADGNLALGLSGAPGSQPSPFHPWFELWSGTSHRVVFGHWSTLGAGDHIRAVSTDSGCVWGGALTAARLQPGPLAFYSVGCPRALSKPAANS